MSCGKSIARVNLTSKFTGDSAYVNPRSIKSQRDEAVHPPLNLSWPRPLIRVGEISKWLFILPGLLLVGLFTVPLLALTMRAVNANFWQYALSEQAIAALRLSLGTSLATVAITIVGGTPLAYMLARWRFASKSHVEVLIDLPIALPPAVAGIALLMAFGQQGLLGPFLSSLHIHLPFTAAAVVIAQTFVAAPLYVRSARIGFAAIDVQIEEAARVEGANQWQLFSYIMFPLAGRALFSGIILTWTRALGEFGATMLFAGNLEGITQTMPLAIYLGFEHNLGVAVALSMMLIAFSVAVLGITRKLEKHEN
jgi:molybdate transport system permease protein